MEQNQPYVNFLQCTCLAGASVIQYDPWVATETGCADRWVFNDAVCLQLEE